MTIIKRSVALFLLAIISVSASAQNTLQEVVHSKVAHKASKKDKHSRYFSHNASVTMADGSSKAISEVKIGENVKTCRGGKTVTTQVKQIEVFEKPSSSLTAVYLRPAENTGHGHEKLVPALLLEATPHHMVQTSHGKKKMKKLSKNDILFHYEPETGIVSSWKVGLIHTNARKVSKAYNIETEEGTYLVANMVMAQ